MSKPISLEPFGIFDALTEDKGPLETCHWSKAGSMSHWATYPGATRIKVNQAKHRGDHQVESVSSSLPPDLEPLGPHKNTPKSQYLMSETFDIFKDLLGKSPNVPPLLKLNDFSTPTTSPCTSTISSSSSSGSTGITTEPTLLPFSRPQFSLDDRKRERAIKNRQSAQASRERKRQYIDQLEEESQSLRCRVATLESEKDTLATELASLKCEFEQLKKLMLGGASSTSNTDNNRDGTLSHFAAANHTKYENSMVPDDGSPVTSRNVKRKFEIDEPKTDRLALQQWVWPDYKPFSSVVGNAIPPPNIACQPPAHSPLASPASLLVSSSGGTVLPDQLPGLNHILRLRLRYRRRKPKMTPSVYPQSTRQALKIPTVHLKTLKKSQTCGSALGKSILALIKDPKVKTMKQMSTGGRFQQMSRQRLNVIWKQIISNYIMNQLQNKKYHHHK